MTKITQAYGWLAAGVLAFGLTGAVQNSGPEWAQRFADRVSDRSAALVDRVSLGTEEVLAKFQQVAAHETAISSHLAEVGARIHDRLESRQEMQVARWEAMSAQRMRKLDRLQANSARMQARLESVRCRLESQAARMQVADMEIVPTKVQIDCPRVRVQVPHIVIARPSVRVQMPQLPQLPAEHADSGPI